MENGPLLRKHSAGRPTTAARAGLLRSDPRIYSTIVEGRPNGMPAWGARLPEEQIWKMMASLRTLGTSNESVKPPKPTSTVYQPLE